MKKIGILTHYYNTVNFGGALQSYALCECLNQKGFKAEQIPYKYTRVKQPESTLDKLKRHGISGLFKHFKDKAYRKLNEKEIKSVKEKKQAAFASFLNEAIPHSNDVYTNESIQNCVAEYDCFITGSDQVWNGYNPVYFLDFVSENKKRISYAASLGREYLTDAQKEVYKESLKKFNAVSVREPSAINLIKDTTTASVVSTIDPTLLLEKEDWDKVSSDKLIEEDYIFCYFLGDYKKTRKLVDRFAKKHNLKIAFIPYTAGIVPSDKKFGDFRFIDASPEDFVSLIKHAKYVFTDSFHAVVFSHIYKKEFFVFNRDKRALMNGRIKDITSLFGCTERYCDTEKKMTLDYIESLKTLDYSKETDEFLIKKKESIEFLENNLKD